MPIRELLRLLNNKDMPKKTNWKIISKKGVNFEILIISLVGRGTLHFNERSKRIFGPLYSGFYRQVNAHRDSRKEDIEKFIQAAKRKEKKKPGSILQAYLKYEREIKKTNKLVLVIKKINPKIVNNLEISKVLEKIKKLGETYMAYIYNYYFLQYLGEELYEVIASKVKDSKEQAKAFEILSQAREFSVMQEEQKELWLLIDKIKKQKLRLDGDKVEFLVNKHLDRFSYMGMYYFRGKSWDKKYILRRIRNGSEGNYKTDLKKYEQFKKISSDWESFTKKLGFSKKENMLVRTAKQMTYCTNLFDETWSYLSHYSKPILNEAAKRLNIKYKDLIEMDIDEIISFMRINKKVSQKFKNTLRARQKDNAWVMENGKVRILINKELEDYKKQEEPIKKVNKNIKQLKGQSASIGKAQGKTVLVYGVSDLSKVKKGDILVAKSTVPSFVPAMEKAGAIITEMGGLLSHAAIVARELSIPCIVGVNQVMEILKDGDKVEVDADKGVVKIIK